MLVTLVTAGCVLHNVCEVHEDSLTMNGLMEWNMKILAPLLNQQKMQQISVMPLCRILATKTITL